MECLFPGDVLMLNYSVILQRGFQRGHFMPAGYRNVVGCLLVAWGAYKDLEFQEWRHFFWLKERGQQ